MGQHLFEYSEKHFNTWICNMEGAPCLDHKLRHCYWLSGSPLRFRVALLPKLFFGMKKDGCAPGVGKDRTWNWDTVHSSTFTSDKTQPLPCGTSARISSGRRRQVLPTDAPAWQQRRNNMPTQGNHAQTKSNKSNLTQTLHCLKSVHAHGCDCCTNVRHHSIIHFTEERREHWTFSQNGASLKTQSFFFFGNIEIDSHFLKESLLWRKKIICHG